MFHALLQFFLLSFYSGTVANWETMVKRQWHIEIRNAEPKWPNFWPESGHWL